MINAMRIRYVTSHFNVLRGLAIIPWGIYYLLGTLFAIWNPPLNVAMLLIILLVGLGVAGISHGLIFTYYQRTFGSVNSFTSTKSLPGKTVTGLGQIWLWIGFAVVTVLAGLLAIWGTRIIDPQYSPIFIYRLLLAIALCLLCLTLWLRERLQNEYGHIPVWPLAAYLLLTLDPPGFLRAGITSASRDFIVALLFISAGIHNHLLLARSLQPIVKEQG